MKIKVIRLKQLATHTLDYFCQIFKLRYNGAVEVFTRPVGKNQETCDDAYATSNGNSVNTLDCRMEHVVIVIRTNRYQIKCQKKYY